MNRYFDNEDEGSCYSITHFKEVMKEENIDKMCVWLGVREIGTDHFFCSHFSEVGIKGQGTCGKLCEGYAPANGKSGRCRHSKNTYFPSEKYDLERKGNKFTLTKSLP